jgi:PDZ domain-containing protein
MTSREKFWLWVTGGLVVVLAIVAAFAPVPFVARSPGPVFDLLGEVDGQPVLAVTETKTYPADGVMDLTTVSEYGGSAGSLTSGLAVLSWVSSTTTVLPDEDLGDENARKFEEAIFDASLSTAQAAAANYLDRPVTSVPVVVSVALDTPAEGVLQAEDEIVGIDGEDVETSEQVAKRIQSQPPGTEYQLVIVRDGKESEVTVASEAATDENGDEVARVGIVVENVYSSDFEVALNLDGIGGPSAGTMLAIAIIDKLTPQDLVAGRHIAGTGTISPAGEVGQIGGITKKMISAQRDGAELFIAPLANCDEVEGQVPEGLAVAAVETLDQAMTAIEEWRSGKSVSGCPSGSQAVERR